MAISHVIRGDDHVNNTPRQINILQALGARVPYYAHLSMILGSDGQKLSKRHGAVSVMQYDEAGYLPQAVVNYLARLGWSHGDDEVFSAEQFCQWFDLDHITPSAAQFNPEKLDWLNAWYLKQADNGDLAQAVTKRLAARSLRLSEAAPLAEIVGVYKERVANLNQLTDAVALFHGDLQPPADLVHKHLTARALPVLRGFTCRLADIEWEAPAIAGLIKDCVARSGIRMPELAMPLRVLLTGQEHTPSVDLLLTLFARQTALTRLRAIDSDEGVS